MTRLLLSVLALAIIFNLPACAPIIVGGAATGVSVVNDRRTAGTIVDDQGIESKIAFALYNDQALANNIHVSIVSYNHVVLVIGQVANQRLHDRVIAHVREQPAIKQIHDEISIATPTSLKTRSRDAWITTRVKADLLHERELGALRIKVITENSVVYLMGLVSHAEEKAAIGIIRRSEGVAGIVKVFEYID